MSDHSQEYQRGFADGRHSRRDEIAQHEARVKELQETVKRKDNYIEGITGALRKACEKLGCDNATDEVWKAAERLRNERDEARKLCERRHAEAEALREQLRQCRVYLRGCMNHAFDDTPIVEVAKDVTEEFHRNRLQMQNQRKENEALRAENARLKVILDPANAEGHAKTLLAWAEIYGAECSCGECTHCAHYLPALQAGAVALAENARLREALENLVTMLLHVHEDPQYKEVWFIAQLHCGPYTGLTYTDELKDAQAALRGGEGV